MFPCVKFFRHVSETPLVALSDDSLCWQYASLFEVPRDMFPCPPIAHFGVPWGSPPLSVRLLLEIVMPFKTVFLALTGLPASSVVFLKSTNTTIAYTATPQFAMSIPRQKTLSRADCFFIVLLRLQTSCWMSECFKTTHGRLFPRFPHSLFTLMLPLDAS